MELTEDQHRAVEVTDRNVVVSAGAGTGKTATLVARFVNLVSSKRADVNEVLTITFTEKAAEEMKRRIADEFQRLGMRAEKAATETAYISTIHSFCARLIRENPFAAGVDPEFEVIDEVSRRLMLGELFDELFAEGGGDFLELAEHYGERAISPSIIWYMDLCRSLGHEVEYVEQLLVEPRVLTEKVRAVADKRAAAALDRIREAIDALRNLEATRSCENKRREIVELRGSLSDVRSFREVAEQIRSVTARMPVVPKSGDSRAACEEVKHQLSLIKGILKAGEAAIFFDEEAEVALLPCKTALLNGAALFWRNYEQRKREHGLLDYEDLQLIARRLLRDNEAIRSEYTEKFRYVLVDEFQDINWLQKELIDLLAREENLFVVGDTRQSIYGFRNADVEIFTGLVGKCRDSARTHAAVPLRENFRSGQNLIHFFDFLFSRLWGGEEPEFDLLRYAREEYEQPLPGSVEILLLAKGEKEDGQNEDSEQVRQREARAVAARIARAVGNAEIPVHDSSIKRNRPVAYGDVAILCRTRGTYFACEQALTELGVPYCTLGGQSFYERQEVADILNLLRAIDNPFQDIPLVAVLRSPFVGAGDETLLLLRRHVEREFASPYVMEALRRAGSLSGISEDDKLSLQRFLSLLENLRRKKDSLAIHELVKTALDSTPYLTRILASRDGMQKAANVQKLLGILRQYGVRESGGIAGFLRLCELMKSYGPEEEEAALESFSGDAVKLMTIHAAKGLEFPVVVVADMARRFNFDRGKFFISKELEIACNPWQESSEDSPGRRLAFEGAKEKQLAEEKRLLYVAMTRARDHLILAGGYVPPKEPKIDKAGCPMDWLLGVLNQEADLPEPGSSIEVQLGDSSVRICVDPDEGTVAPPPARRSLIERYFEQIAAGEPVPVPDSETQRLLPEVRRALQRIASRPPAEPHSPPAELSVSQLMLLEECPYKFFLREIANLPDWEVMKRLGLCPDVAPDAERFPLETQTQFSPGVGGRRFGELVHACLEQIDFRAGEGQDVATIISRYFSSTEEADAAERLIRAFLLSDEAEHLRNAREIHREIAAKALLNGVVVSGVIDVLYLDGENRWTILDFKTGSADADGVSRPSAYEFQMLLYALLVAQATGACPKKAVIYFLGPRISRTVRTGKEELEKTREKVAGIIAAIPRREFARTTGPKCDQCEYSALCMPQNPPDSTTEKTLDR